MDNEPARSNSERSDAVFAARLRGFGPVGLLAILLIIISGNITVGDRMFVLPIGALLVLVWVYLSRTFSRVTGRCCPQLFGPCWLRVLEKKLCSADSCLSVLANSWGEAARRKLRLSQSLQSGLAWLTITIKVWPAWNRR